MRMKHIALIAVSALALSACGSLNKISSDGHVQNEDVRWPKVERNHYQIGGKHQEPGVWVTDAQLDLLQIGMGKAQVHSILGRPHFSEGFVGVREWNHNIMRMIDPSKPKGPDNAKVCQLKTVFDKHGVVQQFMWNPVDCMVEVPKEIPKVPETPKLERLNLSADFLFDFDSAKLRPEASEALDKVVQAVKARNTEFSNITIVGHTDRLGSDAYNQKLSERRALSVATYLIEHGVPAHRTTAFGAGESEPVKDCVGEKPTAELKACLQPNRRVGIDIS